MSKYTEEELNRVLSDTGELLKDIPLSQDYDLEDILAEFGTGATKPKASSRAESPAPEAPPPVAEESEPAPAPPPAEPAPEPEPAEKPAPRRGRDCRSRLRPGGAEGAAGVPPS